MTPLYVYCKAGRCMIATINPRIEIILNQIEEAKYEEVKE
jgi:hypothetical protein